MLPTLLNHTQNHGVWLCQSLQTFNKLRQVGCYLALHCNTHNRWHREFHVLNFMGIYFLLASQGCILGDELIQSNHGHCISTWHLFHRFLMPTHPDHCPLHTLGIQILLSTWHIIGPHDMNLHTCGHLASKHPPKGKELTLVRSWNHLWHIQHERTLWITVPDGCCVLVIDWALIQVLDPVLLGSGRRWQMIDHHLKKGTAGRQPWLHHPLH